MLDCEHSHERVTDEGARWLLSDEHESHKGDGLERRLAADLLDARATITRLRAVEQAARRVADLYPHSAGWALALDDLTLALAALPPQPEP